MATAMYSVPHDEASHRSLIALFAQLEPMWRESWERIGMFPLSRAEHERWHSAALRLEHALDVLEKYARTVDISLGHRDWSSRRPSVP